MDFPSNQSSQTTDNKSNSIMVISGPERIKQHYLNLIKGSQSEILLVIPTINAIRREHAIGVFEELQNAIRRGVKIRLLAAEDDFIKDLVDRLRSSGIVVRRIETPTEAKFKMLIIDKVTVFIVETRDDSKGPFKDAIGNAVLSSSMTTVLPYVTIFESFWRETELYEKAREADRIKDEFVHIAAHELRNPVMPIISGSELLQDLLPKIKDKVDNQTFDEFGDIARLLSRNSAKLLRLSEDILQVSRLESGNLVLNFEAASLGNILNCAIEDTKKRYDGEKPNVKVILDRRYSKPDITLYCDSGKISQTLMNLLDNAMKFTSEGEIVISATVMENEAVVSVADTGTGVAPEIKGHLFEKFATKSTNGTGLGLYLSKRIVEAHGGRIWFEENVNDGATFSFTVPLDDRSAVTLSSGLAGSLEK